MLLETIITSVATSSILLWLTKTWLSERLKRSIQHEYDEKLASHKISLKADADIYLEKLRADLQIIAAKRNIEFNRIHEERLKIISELAGKIDALHQAASAYVSIFEWKDGPTREERRKSFADVLNQFNAYYRPKRLFLTADLADQVETFRNELYNITIGFMIFVEQGKENEVGPGEHTQKWKEASKYASDQAPLLIKEIEKEFRLLLGVDEPKTEQGAGANG